MQINKFAFSIILFILISFNALSQSDNDKIIEAKLALDNYDCKGAKNYLLSISEDGKRTIDLYPYYYAEACNCLGDYQSAIDNYNKYLVFTPGNAEVLKKIVIADKQLRDKNDREEKKEKLNAQKDEEKKKERQERFEKTPEFLFGNYKNINVKQIDNDPFAAIESVTIKKCTEESVLDVVFLLNKALSEFIFDDDDHVGFEGLYMDKAEYPETGYYWHNFQPYKKHTYGRDIIIRISKSGNSLTMRISIKKSTKRASDDFSSTVYFVNNN